MNARAQPDETRRRASWISLGFETLVDDIARNGLGSEQRPFDVLIVGSGYGGAVAAALLAGWRTSDGRPLGIGLLERGQEYLEGAFPNSADDLAGHVRFSSGQFPHARGNLDALFDVRLGEDINVVVANGLGGGSLVNAGVMLEPRADVLAHAFPAVKPAEWDGLFKEARYRLGASLSMRPEVLNRYRQQDLPAKGKALAGFSPSPARFRTVPITVALQDRPNSANVQLNACIRCGDCATGCNYNAKDSLDVNLLVTAASRGVAMYTGATVLRLSQLRKHWTVETVPTVETLRARHGPATRVHAHRVILAAGTLGSTELLLKSRSDALPFSAKLGQQFSSNGDMIAAIRGHAADANAVARETVPPEEREVGPTITAAIDLREEPERPYVIQEMGIPAALRRMFEEITSTASLFQSLARFDRSFHGREGRRKLDPCAVDWRKVRHSSILAVMGDDGAGGVIELRPGEPVRGDGEVAINWKQLRGGTPDGKPRSINDRQMDVLEGLACHEKDAEVLPNPVWRLLPKGIEFLFDSVRGPNITVHPLGGCPMGGDVAKGVVDDHGRVFDPRRPPFDVHEGLVVLDGSVIPQALSVNPSLTITAVALRAVRRLRADWKLRAPAAVPRPAPQRRPAIEEGARPEVKAGALYELRERLGGNAWVPVPGKTPQKDMRYVEITLAYRPFPLLRLMRQLHRHLRVTEGSLRVFASEAAYKEALRPRTVTEEPKAVERRLEDIALCSMPVTGRLLLLHRGSSSWPGRTLRTGFAWFFNRGWRELWRSITRSGATPVSWSTLPALACSFLRIASRAGEIRHFEYRLMAHPKGAGPVAIEGRKRVTYDLDCNIWEQLERVKLTRFGRGSTYGHLEVDMGYFAAQRVPLMRLWSQPNMATSLIELAAFGAYIMRVMVGIHAWSFRRPDPRPHPEPERLPEQLHRTLLDRIVIACKIALTDSFEAGLNVLRNPLPSPVQTCIPMGIERGEAVHIRLWRLPRANSDAKPPVLLIHGYSASGTTFAHPVVRPGLGEYLSYQGRDVWVLDMRTSSGMPTADLPWTFEDAALKDIPAAVAHILAHSKAGQLDVVAHCMGAAMLSIAVLAEPKKGDPYYVERMRLPRSIRSAVLSQVGPLMQFSPLNVLRAYVMRYVRYYLGMSSFTFRVPEEPKLAEQLMDRFLATLRYPPEERAFENRALLDNSFVGTRHRMDSLYGRSFSLLNLSPRVLDRIDDFFGPLHLQTVSQTLHFAMSHRVTDSAGRACYMTREARDARWTFDTFTIHGVDNGLMDVATRNWIDNYFNADDWVGVPPKSFVRSREFPSAGHQDSLIGKTGLTAPIFGAIRAFLDEEHGIRAPVPRWCWTPRSPWAGPIWAPPAPTAHRFAMAGDPGLGVPDFALCVPVIVRDDPLDPKRKVYTPKPINGTINNTQLASVFILGVDADANGWHRIELQKYFLDANHVSGVLILHCYDHTAVGTQTATAAGPVTPLGDLNRRRIARILRGRAVESSAVNTGEPALDRLLAELNQGTLLEVRVGAFLRAPDDVDLEEGFIAAPVERGATPARIFASSCQYPQGILDERVAWAAYRMLGEVLDQRRREETLDTSKSIALLVGDQVYADATAGLFDPEQADDMYRQPYEDLFGDPTVKKALRSIPSALMLDDHEICDNWEPAEEGKLPCARRKARDRGIAAYKAFQRCAFPVPQLPASGSDELWFTVCIGGAHAFVADTRSDRQPRRRRRVNAWSIMAETQTQALLEWLRDQHRYNPSAPKIVAGPAMLLPRRLSAMRSLFAAPAPGIVSPGALVSDSWQGFPGSLARVLAAIAERQVANVIFIGGDDHLFSDATIRVRRTGRQEWTTLYALHASALYAPFPFANAKPADFRERDRFVFAWQGADYECEVAAFFHPQVVSGFIELEMTCDAAAWNVVATFRGADGTTVERRLAMAPHPKEPSPSPVPAGGD